MKPRQQALRNQREEEVSEAEEDSDSASRKQYRRRTTVEGDAVRLGGTDSVGCKGEDKEREHADKD